MSQLTQQIHSSEIGDILENSLNGIRPKKEDYLRLLKSDDVYLMGLVAGNITRKKFGKKVSFVNNIILNYTNVCITDCKFCAFYRPPNHEEAYTLTLDEIEARVKTGWDMFKIRQVLIQGGHNPKLGIEYYEDSFKMIRSKFPMVGVHGLSTSEIDTIAKVEKSSTKEVLSRFKDDKLKKSIMNLATQKGLTVKEMGDKLEVSGNARKVMDLTLAVQKHDVKIEHNMMSAYTAAITKGVK